MFPTTTTTSTQPKWWSYIVISATKKNWNICTNAQTHRTLLTFLIIVCLLLLTGADATSGFVVVLDWNEPFDVISYARNRVSASSTMALSLVQWRLLRGNSNLRFFIVYRNNNDPGVPAHVSIPSFLRLIPQFDLIPWISKFSECTEEGEKKHYCACAWENSVIGKVSPPLMSASNFDAQNNNNNSHNSTNEKREKRKIHHYMIGFEFSDSYLYDSTFFFHRTELLLSMAHTHTRGTISQVSGLLSRDAAQIWRISLIII